MAAGGHLEFDPTGNGAVRPAVPEKPTLEPNMKGIGWRVAELAIWNFPKMCELALRSVVGRRSVTIHTSYGLSTLATIVG